uniref:No exine formation 1 n=1 Tax=Glycine max TaxID=3847 RepID=I1KZJ5_SOYBN
MLQPRAFRPHIPLSSSTSAPSFFSSSSPNPNGSVTSPSLHAHGNTSSSRSLKTPSSFAHNYRIAIPLLPSALFLLDLGGTTVVATLLVGLMISYILDSLNLKPAAFFAVWFSLIFSQLAFFLSSSSSLFAAFNSSVAVAVLASFLCAHTTFLLGVWSSLNFKWLLLENPSIAVTLERLLFACLPISASALFAWASIAALGMNNAAYYLAGFNCCFYWLFSVPRPRDSFILGPLESCAHTLNLVLVPLLFHVASHYSLVLSSAASFCDLLLLFFIPFLFQLYASTRGALWWVTSNPDQLHSIRVVNGAIALVFVVVALEVRVVFHSFARYIQVPPPLNFVLVTITMLGGASATAAYAMGMVSDALSSVAFTTSAIVVSAAGALVVGFPLLFLPLPAVAGFYLARFFEKKSLTSYFAFVILGSLMVTWFVLHNFWDLNIWMAGMSLKSFCKLIIANSVLAMAIPGLALLPSKLTFLSEAGLISHALLLCYIENRFFNYSSIYYYGFEDEVMYPSYMVVMTTLLGLALVRSLSVDHRIGGKAVWILTCLFSSKLAMLFISSKSVVWVSAVLLLAVSPPLLLYRDRSKTTARMKPWQGYVHACVVALSVWFCRETIFEALQWWNGRSPSDGLLLGFCILLTGLACVPIVAIHFSHVLSAKRCLVLVVATGLLFILMQPPLPVSLTYQSNLIKTARHSTDDISIYGYIAGKPTWPSWLLIIAILLTLASITSIIPIKYIVELRTFYSIAMGVALGIYIAAEYFLWAGILHVLIVVTMVCASVFVVFTHLPSATSTKLLPWVFALLVALFPVTYLLEGQLRIKNILEDSEIGNLGEEEKKLTTLLAIEGARTSLLGLYAAIFMLIALEIKYKLASILREKVIDSGGIRQNHSGQSASASFLPRMRFMQHRRTTTAPSFTIKRMAADGAWMPAVGNVATVLCFAICLVLNVNLTGGSNRSIFFLAPILLLLNQDSDFVTGFGDKHRYFPVTVVISAYFVITALYRTWEDVWQGNSGWGLQIGGPDWIYVVKNLALLILTFPSHILFNRYVWSHTKQSDSSPWITLPLNLLPIACTDVLKIKILGILGVIYSLAQYLITRQQYISGLKYI